MQGKHPTERSKQHMSATSPGFSLAYSIGDRNISRKAPYFKKCVLSLPEVTVIGLGQAGPTDFTLFFDLLLSSHAFPFVEKVEAPFLDT